MRIPEHSCSLQRIPAQEFARCGEDLADGYGDWLADGLALKSTDSEGVQEF